MPQLLLSTAYLPPIAYFCEILKSKEVVIEHFETYSKQTYRNRCEIYSANGVLSLTIPVVKTNGNHTLTKDIAISYSSHWQKTHWRAIESAYNSSPFFMYYSDLIQPLFLSQPKYLIDFNTQLMEIILKALKIDIKLTSTEQYEKQTFKMLDKRELFHPKRFSKTQLPTQLPYTQVFQNKSGFIPNLSIIDLLFNEGNFTKNYLISNLNET